MRAIFFAIALIVLPSVEASAACTGDINGFFEKKPLGSGKTYSTVEAFKIDSESSILSMCSYDRSWNAQFQDNGNELIFVYGRRERHLLQSSDGSYVTPSWIAEHKGVKSEYRVRATR